MGRAEKVQPTTDQIVINYHHQLAGVCVTLKKGDGITDTEWGKVDKTVQVDNTIRTCDFNLQTAALTLVGSADRNIQMLPQSSDRYRAVVIPQTVEAGKSLISITIDGQSYSHTLTTPMKYVGGKMHNFTLTVNKSAATGNYVVSFTDGGISDWVNDETSHSFMQNQYVIIDCPEPGTLKDCIAAAGYDYKEMQNMKVKGVLTTEDFHFMRDEMGNLKHLNLNDIKVKHAKLHFDYEKWEDVICDDIIPENAFYGNKSIRSLVLPSKLKRIGRQAFREMQLMFSTLEIPEGVTYIGEYTFADNENNGVELVLPYSLDSICSKAFYNNSYSCEFKMTDNLKYIGTEAFSCGNWEEPSRMHGVFHLSSKLKEINEEIFGYFGNNGSFTGDIVIPQGITSIGAHAFQGVAFKNRFNLVLPSGVVKLGGGSFAGKRFSNISFNNDLEEIGSECFYDASLPIQIKLPSNLRKIGSRAFWNSNIEGELVIPEKCMEIGDNAFSLCPITKLTLPSKLEYINPEAFCSLRELKEITIPKFVDYIGDYAFSGCSSLQTVVCLNTVPPTVGTNPFGPGGGYSYHEEGHIFFDKCVLEVPEQSIELYRNAEGWNKFKNITPHRELACNIPSITCMEKGGIREGVVRSEGAWEVSECPSWVTVTPSSSNDKKTEVKITVNSNSGETREGRIVFRLKNHDYTTYTDVKQVTADVKENQMITLQTATAGSKAIPLFLVGEGYNADDIASGLYLKDMKEQMEHFFSIEPLKSYRNY